MATQTRRRTSLPAQAREAALGGKRAKKWVSGLKTGGGYHAGIPDDVRIRAYYIPTREMWNITNFVKMITWTDQVRAAYKTGSLTVDNTNGETGLALMRPGTVIFVEAKPDDAKRYREFERFMFVETTATSRASAELSISLASQVRFALHNEGTMRTWTYKRDKKHPKGWRADQIAADVCRRVRCPVKAVAKGKYPIRRFVLREATAYDCIAKAYAMDETKTGRHYYVDEDRGKLLVRRPKRRRILLQLDESSVVRDFSFTRTLSTTWATAVRPAGHSKHGKKHRRHGTHRSQEADTAKERRAKVKAQRKARLKRNNQIATAALFGRLVYHPRLASVDDPDYTKKQAQALANRLGRAQKTLQLSGDLNLLLDQGDAVMVKVWFAKVPLRRHLFISAITKTITPGDRTMDVTCAWKEKEVDVATDVRLTPKQATTTASGRGSQGGDSSGMTGGSTAANQKLAHQMMLEMGWSEDQWPSLKALWTHENTAWNPLQGNLEGSGAYGIPQSLPASKMASEGADYLTNPRTQIKWGLKYIRGRYGTPAAAWSHWQAQSPHWY